ncbi:hypothetical protein NM208_g9558 [Fusarium decemcellulare]|uniref:Uncharacterized protein n=1 Tax=Fusarium decemcellulare TaxID=57161 RepID=A0ACC1S139_9HYPO|nr:hypothetical protein NM208_g9558 [Fusarium decemcellulare]
MQISEQKELMQYRLQNFLDTEGPGVFSAESVDKRADRQRALAEVDGLLAGLNYLEKEEAHSPAEPRHQSAPGFDLPPSVDLIGLQFESSGLPQDLSFEPFDEIPNATQPDNDNVSGAERAWSGIRSLRQGIRDEYQRFNSLPLVSTSPGVSQLRDSYPDAETLGHMGILAYRDVLHGVLPETMAEIFAFASLSFVISTLLFRQGRIRNDQILAGLHHWGDCIFDGDDRRAFDALASAMWPQNAAGSMVAAHERKTNSGNGLPQPEVLEFLDLDPGPQPVTENAQLNHGNITEFLQQAAEFASTGLDLLSEPPAMGLPGIDEISAREQEVLDILKLSHEEYNFSQLRHLGGHDAPTVDPQRLQDQYVPPPGMDPRDDARFCTGPIPGYKDESPCRPLDLPWLDPWFTNDTFDEPSSGLDEPNGQLELRILDKASDHPTFKVRNTEMFLAVLAFVREDGDFFFALSGNGQTVICEKRGSGFAAQRSKREKILREEFFEPLKESMSENHKFLALLSAAEEFVILGNFGTQQEVRDFLFTVAECFLQNGEMSAAFVHVVQSHGSSASPVSETGDPTSPGETFVCKVPGCGKTYETASGLSKHRKAKHQEGLDQIQCPKPDCKYTSHRRDALPLANGADKSARCVAEARMSASDRPTVRGIRSKNPRDVVFETPGQAVDNFGLNDRRVNHRSGSAPRSKQRRQSQNESWEPESETGSSLFNMFGKQGPAQTLLTFAVFGGILGNMVVGLPTTPTDDGKKDDAAKVQDVFYSVDCEAATWGVAHHCQAWCSSSGRLNFNTSRCPIGGNNADDIYSDCYCVGECAICKDEE